MSAKYSCRSKLSRAHFSGRPAPGERHLPLLPFREGRFSPGIAVGLRPELLCWTKAARRHIGRAHKRRAMRVMGRPYSGSKRALQPKAGKVSQRPGAPGVCGGVKAEG